MIHLKKRSCGRAIIFIKIYYFTMKGNIYLLFALFLALAIRIEAESTVLTYIVERETNQEDQYVELTLKIQVDGPSLK